MSSLDNLIKDFNKKSKTGAVTIGVKFVDVQRIPFSSSRLNYMTYGGIPTGRIIEFSGAEGSGKTTMALDLVGNAQKLFPDKKVLFVDVEATYDTTWAEKMRVDSENIIYLCPEAMSAGTLLQTIIDFVETGEISLVVLDSIAALISDAESDKSVEDKTYAGISAELTRFGKKVVPALTRNQCTLIGINQLRDDLNSSWGGTNTPGGRFWKHACTVRLVFRKGSFTDERGNDLTRSAENPYGNKINIYLEKSKIFKSNRRTGFCQLNYMEGIDYVSDAIDVATKSGFIEQAGAWFYIPAEYLEGETEKKKVQGKGNLKALLKEDEALLDLILADINEYVVKE